MLFDPPVTSTDAPDGGLVHSSRPRLYCCNDRREPRHRERLGCSWTEGQGGALSAPDGVSATPCRSRGGGHYRQGGAARLGSSRVDHQSLLQLPTGTVPAIAMRSHRDL